MRAIDHMVKVEEAFDVVNTNLTEKVEPTKLTIVVTRPTEYPKCNWINFIVSNPETVEPTNRQRRMFITANVAKFSFNVSSKEWAYGRKLPEKLLHLAFPEGLPEE